MSPLLTQCPAAARLPLAAFAPKQRRRVRRTTRALGVGLIVALVAAPSMPADAMAQDASDLVRLICALEACLVQAVNQHVTYAVRLPDPPVEPDPPLPGGAIPAGG